MPRFFTEGNEENKGGTQVSYLVVLVSFCLISDLISPRMTSIWDLANPQLRDITVYEPGKPIEETARELGTEPDAIIKLASNENPLGPSPKATEAMRAALSNAHLYPDGSGFYLCKAVAAKLGLAPENVILGNGSNEVIEFLGHAFLNPGDDVIIFQYAFIIYKLLATSFAARTIELPTPNFQQDLGATLDAITPKTRLIFIPNPNNPTGHLDFAARHRQLHVARSQEHRCRFRRSVF